MSDQITVLRILRYTGPRADIEHSLSKRGVKETVTWGKQTIEELFIGETLPPKDKLAEINRCGED